MVDCGEFGSGGNGVTADASDVVFADSITGFGVSICGLYRICMWLYRRSRSLLGRWRSGARFRVMRLLLGQLAVFGTS